MEEQQDKNKRIRPREQAGGQKYGAKSSPIIIIPIPVACVSLGQGLELVSKELNHLAAILQDYAGSFIKFFIGKVNRILNNIYFVYG